MGRLFILSLSAMLLATNVTLANTQKCVERAQSGNNPLVRDRMKTTCLTQAKNELSVEQCLQMTKSFEYTNTATQMKNYCLFELKQQATAKQCYLTAKTIENGDEADLLRWSCIESMNQTITKKACRTIAQSMIFPFNQSRALDYCDNEIASVMKR